MNQIVLSLIAIVAFSLLSAVNGDDGDFITPGPPDTCLEGPFHRDKPAREEDEFHECLSWQNEACCNLELSYTISRHKAEGLYNYSWDLCGNLSQKCEEFIKDEECFYQCEPMLWYFHIPSTPGYIRGAPVCASYCNRWFDACKDDFTCVENWLLDFDYALDGVNSCPANSSCVTFAEMYGNGEGLCNRMWGDAFVYSEDESNCTVMAFDSSNPNPNYGLSFPSGSSSVCVQSFIVIVITLMLALISVLF